MSDSEMSDSEDRNVFKILLATDIHIGQGEKDPELADDALNTFEEILKIAVEKEADFVLLGGDLFHENKPSRRCVVKTMELLRKFCVGDKEVSFKMVSDPSLNFSHSKFPVANFDDTSLNISLPIFSIHGNHDDPTGVDNLCALDELSTAGLINLFGKQSSLEEVEMSPILLKKKDCLIALYGLGAMRDERLHRLFTQQKVHFMRPKEHMEDWMNVFVIHQNRVSHGPTNYIPEKFLPNFLDLVFWGHEHECQISPMFNSEQDFYVIQPGSSVVTQLSEGETADKHVALMQVKPGRNFNITPIPLKSTRPFIMRDLVLSDSKIDSFHPKVNEKVEKYCVKVINEMIEESKTKLTGYPKQPSKPLIRLRVDFSGGYDTFSFPRFGQKFVQEVANPRDIIKSFRKAKELKKREKTDEKSIDIDIKPEKLETATVESVIKEHFSKSEKNLILLTEKMMNIALNTFVVKQEKDALLLTVDHVLKSTEDNLLKDDINLANIRQELVRFGRKKKRQEEDTDENDDENILENLLRDKSQNKYEIGDSNEEPSPEKSKKSQNRPDMSLDADLFNDSVEPPKRGRRGRGGGRGSRGRGKRGSTQKKLDSMLNTSVSSTPPKRKIIEIGDSSDEDAFASVKVSSRKKGK